jgi:hypothetical protein
MMVLPGLLQGCLGRTLLARPNGKPERRPSEMHVFAARIISPLAMLAALGAHTLPAAAQDESPDFSMPDRMAHINASPDSADVAGSRPDMAQDEMLMPLKAGSPAFAGHSLILAGIPLQESGTPKTGSISSLKGEMQNQSLNVERSGSPVQNLASKPNHGLHFPLLKQATIANVLVDLKKKFGPESMTQSGNFHLFFDSQRLLATGDKTPSLVACSKMSQWSSICASTNANNFSVYIKGS